MPYNLRECNREQMYLLPPSLQDWLKEGDIAWFVIDAVERMDLQGFYARYREDGWGSKFYDPSMMVSLMLYAYSFGQRSSRKIERLCERDIGFRVVSGNQNPDHVTISRFRRDNRESLEKIFTEVLHLCAEAGLVKVGLVSLDGTKIKANASLESNRTREHIPVEVKRMLSESEAVDTAEDVEYGKDKRGDELPEGLRDRRSRLSRLKECKERLDHEAKAAEENQRAKIEAREKEEKETGQRKRGRKPKAPEKVYDNSKKANITDPDSRIMKTRSGYVQGYNAQASVNEEQVILGADVTMEENDKKQLLPMVEQTEKSLKEAGVKDDIGVVVGDAGYYSETNIEDFPSDGPEIIIATVNDYKEKERNGKQSEPRGRIPENINIRERMERKRQTKRGKALYKKRSVLSEGVFGQMKGTMGFKDFLLRGIESVRCEWKLMCAAHNLMKLYRSGKACWV